MLKLITFAVCILPTMSLSDSVFVTRTIRANTVVTADALTLRSHVTPNVYSNLEDVIGQEARVTLFAGQPVSHGSVGPPALVERNAIVSLVFSNSALQISTEGRSLERGAAGDRIRVMNLSSRTSVFGIVQPDGRVRATK